MSFKRFFDISTDQVISQWLTIPFVALMGLTVLTYYLVNKTTDTLDRYLTTTISASAQEKYTK